MADLRESGVNFVTGRGRNQKVFQIPPGESVTRCERTAVVFQFIDGSPAVDYTWLTFSGRERHRVLSEPGQSVNLGSLRHPERIVVGPR